MTDQPTILLVESDPALRAALKFSLELEGFAVEDHESGASVGACGADCLVLDNRGDGLKLLAALKKKGLSSPAIILASNPTRAMSGAISAAGARLVEKPLLCDGLVAAIRSILSASRQNAFANH